MRDVAAAGRAPSTARREPGLLLVQVDGLSHEHLQRALDEGRMPNLQKRLESGAMIASEFHSGLPSHTGVVEAGVLYGQSVLPSNQWIEKKTGAIPNVTGSVTSDLIEDSFLASGKPGLIEGGSAFLTPLSGNAEHAYFALSEMARVRRAGGKSAVTRQVASEWRHLAWSLATHPQQAVTTVARAAGNFVSEIFARKRDDVPQDFVHDRLKPALWSAVQNIVLTDASVRAMTRSMAAGEPAVFADLPGFDDVSHTHGPDKAMKCMRSIDHNLGVLMDAAEKSDRPYNVVIYSDHGQTANVRFEEAYGQSLHDWTQSLLPAGDRDLQVQDFGTGAHLYFSFDKDALDGGDIAARWPGVLDRMAAHPAIGFVVTRDGDATDIVAATGRVRVQGAQITVTGTNPLDVYGDESVIARQIHDQAHRHGAGDVMLYGAHLGDKIVNFASHPQLGTHGGPGNTQDVAFLIQPKGMGLTTVGVDQASELYDQLRPHLPSDSPAHIP